ncbi:Htur_1727 family rSAM-partnered candidate RiPP [Halorubrum sp. DTA98]|uniref:Htur_1727 family rSAM-partnered candidate RiPP n=1 Tax=Halorubrum sp. DTA98 TaxID=3402163 RepID=UPI003AABC535
MVEKTERTGGKSGPRSADGRRFEVFIRDEEPDPLRHVGTIAAPTPDAAHEEASKLFGWYARDVWICPAAETYRYSAEEFAGEDDSSTVGSGDEHAAEDDDAAEPRVYEETEGTPTVACGRAPIDEAGEREAGEREGNR